MSKSTKLVIIKSGHTLIWIFFNIILFYLLYAAIFNRINKWAWLCVGFIFIEGIVLLLFKMECPLTLIARKYSASKKANFDIYLPEWLARNNKLLYTIFFVIILILVIYRAFS